MLSHFTLVALEQGRTAAHLLGQEATKRAELLLCADDILAGLRTIEGEDEHLVDERLPPLREASPSGLCCGTRRPRTPTPA
jgi:hypothetical protein